MRHHRKLTDDERRVLQAALLKISENLKAPDSAQDRSLDRTPPSPQIETPE